MSNGTVNPMPATAAPAGHVRPPDSFGQTTEPESNHEIAGGGDAQQLPEDPSDADPHEHRRGARRCQHPRVKDDAGIGQGEQGEDEERRDRGDLALEAFGGVRLTTSPLAGDEDASNNACQSGLDAARRQQEPDGQPAHENGPHRKTWPLPGRHHGRHHHHGADQGRRMGAGRVEEGQHQHRTDVIGHGECEEEEPEPGRHLTSEQGQGPEGEGDIGGHRDTPAR